MHLCYIFAIFFYNCLYIYLILFSQNSELQDTNEKLIIKIEEIETIKSNLLTSQNEMNIKYRNLIKNNDDLKNHFENEIDSKINEIKIAKSTSKTLEDQIATIKSKMDSKCLELISLNNHKVELEKQIIELENKLNMSETAYKEVVKESQNFTKELKDIKEANKKKEAKDLKEIKEIKDFNDKITTENLHLKEELNKKETDLKSSKEDFNIEVRILNEKINFLNITMTNQTSDIKMKKSELESKSKDLENRNNTIKDLFTKISSLNEKFKEVNTDKIKFEAENQHFMDSKSYWESEIENQSNIISELKQHLLETSDNLNKEKKLCDNLRKNYKEMKDMKEMYERQKIKEENNRKNMNRNLNFLVPDLKMYINDRMKLAELREELDNVKLSKIMKIKKYMLIDKNNSSTYMSNEKLNKHIEVVEPADKFAKVKTTNYMDYLILENSRLNQEINSFVDEYKDQEERYNKIIDESNKKISKLEQEVTTLNKLNQNYKNNQYSPTKLSLNNYNNNINYTNYSNTSKENNNNLTKIIELKEENQRLREDIEKLNQDAKLNNIISNMNNVTIINDDNLMKDYKETYELEILKEEIKVKDNEIINLREELYNTKLKLQE